jgi:hypothetical protein
MRLVRILLITVFMFGAGNAYAQRFLMDMVDTTTELGKGMLSLYQKYGTLRLSLYIQPQFQVAQDRGIKNYSGGDFATNSNSRFMLRRARLRTDYAYYNKDRDLAAYFAFQIDVTERGSAIRDVWGRVFENNWQMFSLTTGMFARPFGFEVNLSSIDRESPERGRMSQILMRTERDMGVMATFEQRKKSAKRKFLKADLGVFNGQGLAGPMDFDSYKDMIGRISVKPVKTGPLMISGSTSILYGAIGSQSDWVYETEKIGDTYKVVGDSTPDNYNKALPRHYYGADIQLKHPHKKWATELRAEYIFGTQTATAATSETPGTYPVSGTTFQPLFSRQFDGAYFCFLQNIAGSKHQFVVKYDWYDPNKLVSGNTVTAANGFTPADVRYNTLGAGYVFYANPHVKATLWYDIITNESTALKGYTSDIRDNILTCRLQYRF